MNTMKTMTLDDIKKISLTEKEKEIIKKAKPTYDAGCPKLSKKELKEFKPWYEVHPQGNDYYKVKVTKKAINIKLDSDILEAFKSKGKGYQTRINETLRKAMKHGWI